ncbi:MAG: STAS domain-containing protein [Pseudomonadales bacterium]|nr:STAS domain-containing protein [Pseudomonadales bacterium]
MANHGDIKLVNNCNIASAEALAHQLEELFRTGAPVDIDASEVERIDTAVAQILYSFFVSMQQSGLQVVLQRPSEAFIECVTRLGLKSYFEN